MKRPSRNNTARPIFMSSASAVLVAAALGSLPASACPKEGEAFANARVEDADDHALELKSLKGKPFVIVYDDRASASTSESFRKELMKVAKSAPYRSSVSVVLTANVGPYNYWPVKGVVKDAVRDSSKKQGTTVYCDWTGELRSAYHFKDGVSNVVVVGKDGHVAFASDGAPSGADQKRFFDALREQVEGG
jgi:predicted transcriptional regulator